MHKLILIALLGCALIALTGASEQESESSLQQVDADVSLQREAREARKNDKKKNNIKKKKRKSKNLKKRDNKRKGKGAKKRKGKGKKSKGKKKGKKRVKGKKTKKGKGKKKARKSKGKKKGKKRAKGKKTKKGKNGKKRKSKKARKTKGTRKNGRQSTACAVPDTCVVNAVTYMKMNKDKVTNYLRQLTRIKKQNGTGEKKAGKKDVFKASLNRLTQNGGGNVSKLMCGKESTGTGATKMKELADTLMKCSDSVKAACDPSKLPQPDMTKVNVCKPQMEKFQTKVEECRKKTGAEACTCWGSTDLSSAATVIKNCSLADQATAFAKALKGCRDAFGNCRSKEDEVAGVMHSCNANKDGLVSKLKQLAEVKNSVKAAATKVKSIIASAGKKRYARALATCSALITQCTLMTNIISQNAASRQIIPIAILISTATVTCNAADVAQLTAISAEIDAGIEAIEAEEAAVQSTLLTLTGTTASAAAIGAAATCATDDCDPNATTAAPATTAAAETTAATVTTKSSSKKKRRQAVEDILKAKLV